MITEYHRGDIFELPNPMFLADTFVFNIDGQYIKVNGFGRIEEIGTNIVQRLHCVDFDAVVRYEECEKACKRYRRMLKMIDGEYFGYLNISKLW